jgi:hypothetical protein
MSLSIAAACLWLIIANVIAMFPSRDYHWRNAYLLITVGIPLLIWVAASAGWLMAAVFLVAGASVLRWPVYFLARWAKSLVRRKPAE